MGNNKDYNNMWEDFAKARSKTYLGYKFQPTYRVGLTNYLRQFFIFKLINPHKDDIILDCGCAAGKQLFGLHESIKSGYGTDIAQNFIDAANKYKEEHKINNIFFKRSDIENMPFEDAYFDKIICAEVLEHVFDKDVAMKELLRILKSDGILLITVPNLNADATLWGRFLRLIKVRKFKPLKVFSKEELAKHGDAHVREFDRDSLNKWVESYNLKILDIKSISFIDGPPIFEFLLKILLHIKITQKIIISLDKLFTKSNMFFGRHLIIKATRK